MTDVGGAVLLHTIVADAYERGLAAGIAQERERCARLVETIVVSGPEDDDIDHDDYRDSQIAAAIRAGEASE